MSLHRRLERQLTDLKQRENRLGNWRITVFVLGFIFTTGLVVARVPWAGVFATSALLLFIGLVVAHWRARLALTRREVYVRILSREKARAELDWSRLPETPPVNGTLPRYFDDLDLRGKHSLLQLVNACVSNFGFSKLVKLFDANDIAAAEISRRQKIVRELSLHRALRRKIWLHSELESEGIMDLMTLDDFLAKPFHSPTAVRWVIALGSLQAAVLILLICFVARVTGAYFAIPWALSFIVFTLGWPHFYNPFGRAVSLESTLSKFLRVARVLENFKAPASSELANFLSPFQKSERPTQILRKLSFLVSLLSLRAHGLIYVIVHMFLPWDFVVTLLLERMRGRLRADVAAWSEAFSDLEAFLSLAEFTTVFPKHTFPTVVEGTALEATNLRHPLIPAARCVGNPAKLGKETWCYLITGSNMSGKSTFLRTIGINVVLAKAGAPVFADEFSFGNCRVYTMLRVADSLEDQVSSFYAEVKELKQTLDAAKETGRPPVLYLIDEIFRGTNNRERLLGSRAYIETLAKLPAFGLIATHDLELVEIAHSQKGVGNFHFKETIAEGKMAFSYRLETGPCPTTNALKIMEMAGLPLPS